MITSCHEEMIGKQEFKTEQDDDTLHWERASVHKVSIK